MFQLIITVMSIALVAITTAASINYTNPLLPIERQAESQLFQGFETLAKGWDRYRDDHRTYAWDCDTHSTEFNTYEACNRVVDAPGHLPVAGWSAALVPDYIFLPTPPAGMAWSYGTNAEGSYFCAEGSASKSQAKGFQRARSKFMVDQMQLSTTCGATSSLQGDALDLGDLKITYWLLRN